MKGFMGDRCALWYVGHLGGSSLLDSALVGLSKLYDPDDANGQIDMLIADL